MNWRAAKAEVLNRGSAPYSFLDELVAWGKTAPEEIFAPNTHADIYGKVKAELGPWEDLTHRRAVMLEVLRVLAGFESSWDWKEGVDTSRLGETTPANAEAGAWQVSYDSRSIANLVHLLEQEGVRNGLQFQQAMKFNHPLAMEYVARLMRYETKANGPLYKGEERNAIRKSLRDEKHSIYPWLSREAVAEFRAALA